MQLYSKDGQPPAPLPNRITLSDGRTRTNRDTFTEGEIRNAGYIKSEPKPEIDPATQRVVWDDGAWIVTEIEQEEPEPVSLSRLQFVRLLMSAGGLTNTHISSIVKSNDPNVNALWSLMQLSEGVELTDPIVVEGLAMLEEKDLLPNKAKAVRQAWPTR